MMTQYNNDIKLYGLIRTFQKYIVQITPIKNCPHNKSLILNPD